MIIKNALVYCPDHTFTKKTVYVEKGKFAQSSDDNKIDAEGLYLVPGFIDIHTHGGNNIDVNHLSKENFASLSAFFASVGTTSFLASVLTDTEENTLSLMDTLSKLTGCNEVGAELLGIHLEGPFISHEYKGAMPESLLRDPNIALIREYQERAKNTVKYLTLAPELPGSIDLIKAFKDEFAIAIGHSAAEYDTAMESI
ncbi:MAG: amidohydrolase family protein, partial [Spirochaetales bacterium]|nr:amidohydrolase family protein [Spirochaetales bacterium]